MIVARVTHGKNEFADAQVSLKRDQNSCICLVIDTAATSELTIFKLTGLIALVYPPNSEGRFTMRMVSSVSPYSIIFSMASQDVAEAFYRQLTNIKCDLFSPSQFELLKRKEVELKHDREYLGVLNQETSVEQYVKHERAVFAHRKLPPSMTPRSSPKSTPVSQREKTKYVELDNDDDGENFKPPPVMNPKRFKMASAIISNAATSSALQKPRIQFYTPTRIVQSSPIPVKRGFKNLGNTCYISSVVQALLHLPLLTDELKKIVWGSETLLLNAYMSVVKGAHDLSNLKRVISQYDRKFDGNRQQDADEFLRSFLSMFELDCSRADTTLDPKPNPIESCFEFELDRVLECTECQYACPRPEKFRDLSLFLPPTDDTETSLLELTQLFMLQHKVDLICEKCPSREALTKFETISDPNVLTMQLKRFDVAGKEVIKRPIPIPFPLTLAFGKSEYSLKCLICHLGREYVSGHYVCDVLDSSGVWQCYNDSLCERVGSFEDLLKKRVNEAYLFFYVKL